MKAWHGAALLVVGFGAGFGLAASRGSGAADARGARDERDAAKARAEKAEAELAALRESKRRPRENPNPNEPPGAVRAASRSPFDVDAPPPKEDASSKPGALSPAARARRVTEIRGTLAAIFQNHEGDKALAALKELASLVPEGREDAMKLALDINKDVDGAGTLRLPQQTFYLGLGDPAVHDLMAWSLENPGVSSAEFRRMSVWSLPWDPHASVDDTIARFDSALAVEPDRDVQKAIVSNLGQINSSKAEAALVRVLGDGARDAALRGDAAMALATSSDVAAQRALEVAADSDTDPRIQTAERVSLVVRNPPATGCLVVQTTPDGTADSAGLRAGDVIVSYNGKAVAAESELSAEIKQAAGSESVAMVIVRDGREQTLAVKPTRIDRGTWFKPVAKK